jgi:hypothetical protein
MAKKNYKHMLGPKDLPPFSVGDMVSAGGWFWSTQFKVPRPCKVLSVQRDHLCVGGWSITVETSAGKKDLSANIFSLHENTDMGK